VKKSYRAIGKQGKVNEQELAGFLANNGQILPPMVDPIEQCRLVCDELIDVTGRAAIEPTFSGMEVPWRFHLLVTSDAAIPLRLLEDNWRILAGHKVLRSGNEGYAGDSVVVESYEHNRGGPEYCLKSMNTCDGDWLFRWLDLFNPPMKRTSSPNHIEVRQRARFPRTNRVKLIHVANHDQC
jgi:hypothetical protein